MGTVVIGIAGGTGSGKSTFTNRLKKAFGDEVAVVYHDNYYRRQDGVPFEERKKVNYDHPDSLETDLMVEHLKKLKEEQLLTVRCMIIQSTTAPTERSILSPDRSFWWKAFFFWRIRESGN